MSVETKRVVKVVSVKKVVAFVYEDVEELLEFYAKLKGINCTPREFVEWFAPGSHYFGNYKIDYLVEDRYWKNGKSYQIEEGMILEVGFWEHFEYQMERTFLGLNFAVDGVARDVIAELDDMTFRALARLGLDNRVPMPCGFDEFCEINRY